jgi:Putative phage holin Dp-1
MITGKTYDVLKLVAMVILPGIATLYIGLGQIWGFPAIEEVGASIVLVNTFLGGLLQLNSRSYYKDDANFDGFLTSNGSDEDTGIPNLQMTITKDPNEILAGQTVRLKVGEAPKRAA